MQNGDALIPLVDVSADEAVAAARVHKACTESGFFYGEEDQPRNVMHCHVH